MATPGVDTIFQESQILTRAAPTLSTEGQLVEDFSALTLCVQAEIGQTLTSGSMACWMYDKTLAVWLRMPAMDQTISTAGFRNYAFASAWVIAPRYARILFAASGVVVSGGTTVTVSQLGFVPTLQGRY